MLSDKKQFFDQLEKARSVIIFWSNQAGQEAIASALALSLFIKKIGKNVILAGEKNDNLTMLDFLPEAKNIVNSFDSQRQFIISLDTGRFKANQVRYQDLGNKLEFIITPSEGKFKNDDVSLRQGAFHQDLIITLNAADLESLGRFYDQSPDFFYETTLINIDRQAANESFGQINLLDLNAVSTAEILFELFNHHDRSLIDEEIATCLLASIIIATRSFKTGNISPNALSIAAQLIAIGGRREEIVDRLYRSRSLSVLKLWGILLARLEANDNGRIIRSVVLSEDFLKTNTSPKDLKEAIDELITNIPEAKIIILSYESTDNQDKASQALIYGLKQLDVVSLSKELGSEGEQKNLALIKSDKPAKILSQELSAFLEKKLDKLEKT
jgi:nanoRNase/pAp phosphatase (c-di-AMP/oligoRNAs hydrolase)